MLVKKLSPTTIIISLVVILGAFIRFYRFTDLMNFSFGQGNALNLSAQMIDNRRPALISQIYSIRETPSNHSFFHSGAYLYPLAPLQILFNYNPVPITAAFAIMNILSAIGLYFIVKNFFTPRSALLCLILFLFSPLMIGYSRFIWHVNLLIPIITIALWILLESSRKIKPFHYLLLGILSGLGFGIHIGFTIPGVVFFLWTFYKSIKHRHPFLIPFFLGGVLIGDLPVVIFDLRNNFYNTGTMIEFLTSLGQGTQKGGFSFESYHFVSLVPPAFLIASVAIDRIFRKFSPLIFVVIVAYLGLVSPHWGLRDQHPAGMVPGWNYAGLTKAASLIAADQPPAKYEIASIIDGETRSTNMRYLLTWLHHIPPMGVLDYPQAEVLYLLARPEQDPTNYNVWEINTIKPVKIINSWPIQNNIYLYKIVPQ